MLKSIKDFCRNAFMPAGDVACNKQKIKEALTLEQNKFLRNRSFQSIFNAVGISAIAMWLYHSVTSLETPDTEIMNAARDHGVVTRLQQI